MRKKQILKDDVVNYPDIILPEEKAAAQKGSWKNRFICPENELWLEIGCGRGQYINEMAQLHPERNFLGVDIKADRLVTAVKKGGGKKRGNIQFAQLNFQNIAQYIASGECAGVIINFPEPRIKARQSSWRITHPKNLEPLLKVLGKGAHFWFKTDDHDFYNWSRPFLLDVIEVRSETRDFLHHPDSDYADKEPLTEYHEKWLKEGKKIISLKGRIKKTILSVKLEKKTWKQPTTGDA